MRVLPQPVVVVTSSMTEPALGTVRKGVTCSSFTSLTLEPPTVLISIYSQNIINKVIENSQLFAVNLLSDKQLKEGMHFAKALSSSLSEDQFSEIKYTSGYEGLPVLEGAAGKLQCRVSSVDTVGDHKVWHGTVIEADVATDATINPMLYYQRSFRSIGDEIFMQAFENASVPFADWTHEAHLRMAWNYITKHGKDMATPLIKTGIQKFNEKNKHKITYGYSETVTKFYIHIISKAISHLPVGHTFEDFLISNKELTESAYLSTYYSEHVLNDPISKLTFIKPDKISLPS
ncbi:hypothetical protein EB796_010322 [Bugula neritina]|uniref:Flavin reductase like domain-containing protein n=1 Tax=Bugula neritina TaxID=10212 RepID=A0A7J7JYA1_BUGNE|nr:hypothetical protein EB796_010322 [Bugula neritina]